MSNSEENYGDRPIKFVDLIQDVLDHKKLVILLTGIIAVISVVYVLSVERTYIAETLVKTSANNSSGNAMDGGLAGLLGFQGQGTQLSSSLTDLPSTIAIMNSREFLEKFIIDHQLMTEIFNEQWDKTNKKWKNEEEPSVTDGFKALKKSIKIVFDPIAWTRRQIGYAQIEVSWKNSNNAAYIANHLVEDINLYLSLQMISEAKKSIDFLDEQAIKTNVITVKESLYALKTEQLRNMMLANSSKDFALIVIDNALPPEFPSSPKRVQFVIVSTIFGFLFSLFLVFFKDSFLPLYRQLRFRR
jgi:uncharacterized protein involved in exopolysaccharide biosynthesis